MSRSPGSLFSFWAASRMKGANEIRGIAMRRLAALLLVAAPVPAVAQSAPPPGIPIPPIAIEEQSIDQLQASMASIPGGSALLTTAYLNRIADMNRKGPALRAVIAVNPDAMAQAKASDARRKAGKLFGPLDGIPILIKDNIETRDPIATTAGSLALKDNITGRDAPVVALLRAQGAVILGKTNLSEWANIRSTKSMSGWSAVGGWCAIPMRSIALRAGRRAAPARRSRRASPRRGWGPRPTGRSYARRR